MDLLFEIIFELLFEGSLEASQNKKLSKWIRYPLIFIVLAFFTFVIGIILLLGITLLDENIAVAILIIIIGLILLIGSIVKFRKMYLIKK